MIFSELYNVYYNAVAEILTKAVSGELTDEELNRAIMDEAFGESFMTIVPALKDQKWQLLNKDLTTPLYNAPSMPLTNLQKRWLKAISLDPRIRLFDIDFSGLEDVEPLFTQDDYVIFDKYNDGDKFEDPVYIEHFRMVMDSIRNHYPLTVVIKNRNDNIVTMNIIADSIEYSEKDDKFRIITRDRGKPTINIGRIQSCERCNGRVRESVKEKDHTRKVIFDLTDERNALERAMLHFAHFEKETEKICDNKYRVTVYYDWDDETELVIRILSFGPRIKVIDPKRFIGLIKQRLEKQKNLNL